MRPPAEWPCNTRAFNRYNAAAIETERADGHDRAKLGATSYLTKP